jgi:dihydroxyacetone kinase phosphotransfer subunit
MVGVVLVSHSRPLALATQDLVRAMTGPALPLVIAAGTGDNHAELGTDAVEISEAIRSVQGPDGVLVLMDMGSAILSSETALDLLEEKDRANVRFCPAPFVEGAVAAGVTANLGASLADVFAEAVGALKQKRGALPGENATVPLPEIKASQTREAPQAAPHRPQRPRPPRAPRGEPDQRYETVSGGNYRAEPDQSARTGFREKPERPRVAGNPAGPRD